METSELMGKINIHGLEYFKTYYGMYPAKVIDNNDDKKLGRVCVQVYGIQSDPLKVWVNSAFPGAGVSRGLFWPPEIGDNVYVVFHQGRPDQPLFYLGGWHSEDEQTKITTVPKDFKPNSRPTERGLQDSAGNRIILSSKKGNTGITIAAHHPSANDTSYNNPSSATETPTADIDMGSSSALVLKTGAMLVNSVGCLINLDSSGVVQIVNKDGQTIALTSSGITILDNSGNVISLDGGNITITATGQATIAVPTLSIQASGIYLGDPASHPAVLGDILTQWLSTHTHPTGVGPSGPPIQNSSPMLSDTLSAVTKLK